MATRLPASQRTREELTALIEGRLSTVSAKDELVKLATRLIVEEALEGEAGDASGEITTNTVRSQAMATVMGIAWDG
jgi:putative transposase